MCDLVAFYARVTTREMLEHLQVICVGNHEIDMLELQDKMRVMHTEHYWISQYIRALEEAQQQAEREGMPITDATLVIIVTKAMIATQQFPTTNEKLEDLGRSAHIWGKWKELYKNQRNKQG